MTLKSEQVVIYVRKLVCNGCGAVLKADPAQDDHAATIRQKAAENGWWFGTAHRRKVDLCPDCVPKTSAS